jgi:ketosteroid isomerase-like protein
VPESGDIPAHPQASADAGLSPHLCHPGSFETGRAHGPVPLALYCRYPAIKRQTHQQLARRDTDQAMSQENVEIVRRAHAALNAGDIDALIALCDPAFRLDMSDRVLNPMVYGGHGGIRRFYGEVRDVWASYTWEPEELIESGNQVVALLRSSGRGRGSGIEMERHTAMVWTVRDKRATSMRFFRNPAEALEVTGRRE